MKGWLGGPLRHNGQRTSEEYYLLITGNILLLSLLKGKILFTGRIPLCR